MSASTTSTTSRAVSLPEPYDFELSTERYRAFGPDLANLWQEGGLHRVFDGREVRIDRAPGGVRIQPGDSQLVDPVRTPGHGGVVDRVVPGRSEPAAELPES